jgi:hypothetical protein
MSSTIRDLLTEDQNLVKKSIFYILATLLIATLIFTTYFGLIQFFYCSFLVLLSYIVNILTYIASSFYLALAKGLIWCIFQIPLIEVLLSINLKVLASFFSQIWTTLSYTGIAAYIDSEFATPRCDRRYVILKFVLISLAVVAISIALSINFVKGNANQVSSISFVIGVVALIGPVFGFFKLLALPYLQFFHDRQPIDVTPQEVTDPITAAEPALTPDELSVSWIDP